MTSFEASNLPIDHVDRVARARVSLEGLSVGDALGERFFYKSGVEWLIDHHALPAGTWKYTDDTVMALSIVEILTRYGRIETDALAERFAERTGPTQTVVMVRPLWKSSKMLATESLGRLLASGRFMGRDRWEMAAPCGRALSAPTSQIPSTPWWRRPQFRHCHSRASGRPGRRYCRCDRSSPGVSPA